MTRFPGAALCLSVLLGAVLPAARAAELPPGSPPTVRVVTSMGDFVIELDPERAPLTVADFLRYVSEGHYTGTIFHRVIANFLIQGGGFGTDYVPRPAHEPIPNESGNGLMNVRGAVGLARGTGPHTGDAQFFVDLADNPDLNPLPTRWGYAVFGHVTEGMDVVDRIGFVATGAIGPLKKDAPVKPVVIERVVLLNPPPAAPQPPATPATPPAPTAAAPAPAPAPSTAPAGAAAPGGAAAP
jgi:cyclophilin family peptidyl-prolyl cis-trans isomerase